MTIQVLISTMNQPKGDYSLLEKMNIQTDAIVINQCDYNEITEFVFRDHLVKWMSLREQGVGLSRNTALVRADHDIALMSDDDVVLFDGYEQTILSFYENNPKADVVLFNYKERRGHGKPFVEGISKTRKICFFQATKFATPYISFRNDIVKANNIHFHRQFGGHTKYSCGEDTIFLRDCFRHQLYVYECRNLIATLDHGDSSWFHGYNEKFFLDRGALFCTLNRNIGYLYCLYYCLKYRDKLKEFGWWKAFLSMLSGCAMRKKELRSRGK